VRLLNFCLVALLVVATAYVYEIKFEATQRYTKVVEMRKEVRRQRDAIAALHAEYARLENPARLEKLAQRFLTLRPAELSQFDSLDGLPQRPPELPPPSREPLSAKTETDDDAPTASIPQGAR